MLSLLTADRETSIKCRHFNGRIPAIRCAPGAATSCIAGHAPSGAWRHLWRRWPTWLIRASRIDLPLILIRIGYGYVVVRIGCEAKYICILIFGLALFFPIFAAHLQDDKSCLSFTRFMELCPPGGRKVEKFTLEEAEATAARDGLVLVPSRKNPSRYKGVTLLEKYGR
jgi:hypothetical protein